MQHFRCCMSKSDSRAIDSSLQGWFSLCADALLHFCLIIYAVEQNIYSPWGKKIWFRKILCCVFHSPVLLRKIVGKSVCKTGIKIENKMRESSGTNWLTKLWKIGIKQMITSWLQGSFHICSRSSETLLKSCYLFFPLVAKTIDFFTRKTDT